MRDRLRKKIGFGVPKPQLPAQNNRHPNIIMYNVKESVLYSTMRAFVGNRHGADRICVKKKCEGNLMRPIIQRCGNSGNSIHKRDLISPDFEFIVNGYGMPKTVSVLLWVLYQFRIVSK